MKDISRPSLNFGCFKVNFNFDYTETYLRRRQDKKPFISMKNKRPLRISQNIHLNHHLILKQANTSSTFSAINIVLVNKI